MIIRVDRSRRLKRESKTDFYHEVIKDGKLFHGPRLEPQKRKMKKNTK
jgi:hypothetical protein